MSIERYPNVFNPIQVGPVEIENRFYFPPHGNLLSAGGAPSNYFAHYYAERAAGGCGLLIQSLPVLPTKIGRQCPYYEEAIPSFRAVADLIHQNGAKIFGQLHYWWGSGGQWEPFSPARPTLGASAYQRFDHYSVTHEMGRDEIDEIVEAYRTCARNLAAAGYDGIEYHISHGILPEHFLSPYWNRRGDEYGGDLENRMRFVVRCLEAIHEGAGADLAVGIRFNCDEMLPGGWNQLDAREILAKLVEKDLIHFADLDIAVEPNQFPLGMPNYYVPEHSNAGFVRGVRESLGSVPVLSALGRVTTVQEAEDAIGSGLCDMVGAARGLIAEPELVNNARAGREDESRICIACNWCTTASKIGAFGCAINPASGRELRWGVETLKPGNQKAKVVVVGGGPAGMEASRVAARRGHQVVLFEGRNELGGQLRLLAGLPGRDSFNLATDWWSRQLESLDVDVRLGATATVDSILDELPEAIIIATGSRYASDGESGFISQAIPGADQSHVFTPEMILEDGRRPEGRVIVLDDEGLNTGVGIAELLARDGASVELVTRWMQPMEFGIYTFEFSFVIPTLKQLGVQLSTQTYIKEIDQNSVTLFDVFTNEERTAPADAVVLSTMRRPQTALVEALRGKADQVFVIGDALAPRGFADAAFEGQMFARYVSDPDAPRDFKGAFFARLPSEFSQRPASVIHA